MKLPRLKIKNRYWISFLLVVAFAVTLVTVLIFALYANIQIETTRNYSIHQLEQVCQMTDILHEQMRSLSNQILQSADTNRCLSTTSFSRLQEAKATIKLREMQSSVPYVRYVNFYNSASNRFISSSTVDFLSDADIDYYHKLLDGTSGDNCTMRLIGSYYATQDFKSRYVYSFIFEIRVRNSGSTDLAIVDVDEEYFMQALNNLRTTEGYQQILLLDRKGDVISANAANGTDKAFSRTTDISLDLNALPDLSGDSGYLSFDSNGTQSLVTWAKAPSSGLTVINIVPYSNIFAELPRIAALTVIVGIIVLALGIFVTRRTSARLSAPIEVLYKNYVRKPSTERGAGNELEQLNLAVSEMSQRADKLEQGLIASYSESKNRCIQRLLHGEYTNTPNYRSICKQYGIDLSAPYYCIVAMQCASPEDAIKPEDSNYFICQYALENITAEVLGQYGHITTYHAKRDMLAVLLPMSANAYPLNFASELKRICTVMQDEFNLGTTICVGSIVESADNINLGYEATALALKHRPIGSYGQVFFADDLAERMNFSQYHNKLHMKLAELIRREDIDACGEEIDLAIAYMKGVSFLTAVTYFNHVMMSLMDDFSAAFSDDGGYNLLMEKLDQIDRSLPNVHMLRQRCMEFVTLLVHHLSINRKHGNEQAAETARVYIDKNYANPDLTLRMLADMARLSPAYFGKVFTAQTTFTFNDYLTNTRMKKAEQLLTETKLPINKISESIGILNTNYFYSIFKKKYGMTPLAYRRANSGKE